MRQGQPDAAELSEAGGVGIDKTTGDAKVRHRVAVEQHVAVERGDGKGDKAYDDGGETGGEGLLPGRRAHGLRVM